MKLDKNDEETRHPTHRRYRWWSGMLKGAVAGASPTGPWTDRRTGVRTPDHDERQPWRIPLDRPCLLPNAALNHLCFSAKIANNPPIWNPSIYCHNTRTTHCEPPQATLRESNPRRPASGPLMIPLYYTEDT